MKWREVEIGQLVELCQGLCINKKSNHLVAETGLPLLRITDMINRKQSVFIKEEVPEKFIAKPDDIIYSRTGQVGLVFRNQFGVLFNNCFTVTPVNDELSKDYLYWFLRSDNTKKLANDYASGAAQLDLSHSAFKCIKIKFPTELSTQRKIASILSAYDDLIENNLKRIKLLEEKAEIVYKEEFDFFKPSNEVNKLPIGWKVQRADEIFRINIGKTPPREQQEWFNDIDSGVKWVSIKDINNSTVFLLNTSETVTENAVNKFNMNVAKSETVILSFKLTVGKVAITTEEMVTNEAIAHFNIDDETKMNSEFIYFYLKNFPYDSLGSTSSIGTAINSKIVKAMPVLLPSEKVIEDFGNNVKPAFQLIKTLLKQNTKLREARDILLPKLMNGQIEV